MLQEKTSRFDPPRPGGHDLGDGDVWLFMVAALAPVRVAGQVVDGAGHGVGGVTIFAVDARSEELPAWATSDATGGFVLALPARRHRFGVASAEWSVVRVEKGRPLRIVVQRQAPPAATARGELVVGGGPLALVTGRVIDETGAGLPGVGLTLVGPRGGAVAAITTGAGGVFTTAAGPGRHQLLVSAPGLALRSVEQVGQGWQITLAVAAGANTVRIQVDPLETPPDAHERARLAFRGIKMTGLPSVSPAIADLQREQTGTSHPVARQPPGGFCIRTTDCARAAGLNVCCASNGDLTDEYLWLVVGGIAGTSRPVADCPGARKRRR
jgi:hypothetical protein